MPCSSSLAETWARAWLPVWRWPPSRSSLAFFRWDAVCGEDGSERPVDTCGKPHILSIGQRMARHLLLVPGALPPTPSAASFVFLPAKSRDKGSLLRKEDRSTGLRFDLGFPLKSSFVARRFFHVRFLENGEKFKIHTAFDCYSPNEVIRCEERSS